MIGKLGPRAGLGLGTNRHSKAKAPVLNVVWVGQDNAFRLFNDFGGSGNSTFVSLLAPYFSIVNSINAAKNDVAIHKDADAGKGYYYNPPSTPGAELTNILSVIDSAGINRADVDVVVISHGDTDSIALESGTVTEGAVKSAMLSYINYLHAELDNPLILLTPTGAHYTGTSHTGWGKMRRIQYELWTENDYIWENPPYYDQPMNDDTHLTKAGYEAFGQRTARRILGLMRKISPAGTLGPRVKSASFSPVADKVYLDIEHDNGTDFTLSENRGHYVSQNGTLSAATAIIRANGTRSDVTASSNLLTGDTVQANWPWGTLAGYTPAGIVKDNGSYTMPLRPFFGLNATEI